MEQTALCKDARESDASPGGRPMFGHGQFMPAPTAASIASDLDSIKRELASVLARTQGPRAPSFTEAEADAANAAIAGILRLAAGAIADAGYDLRGPSAPASFADIADQADELEALIAG